MRSRFGAVWMVAAALCSPLFGEDAPTVPAKRANVLSPDAKAAVDRFHELIYRPRAHGVKTASGTVRPEGISVPVRASFELDAEGELVATLPPEFRKPFVREGIVWNAVRRPLAVAFDPWLVWVDGERETELVQRDGAAVLVQRDFEGSVLQWTYEFTLDPRGLVVREVARSAAESVPGYVARYMWSPTGERFRLDIVELTFEKPTTQRYACSFRYVETAGAQVPVAYEMTALLAGEEARVITFWVDTLIVNGKPVDVTTPWHHASRVTPEARTILERYERSVYRPTERGLRSLAGWIAPKWTANPGACGFELDSDLRLRLAVTDAENPAFRPVAGSYEFVLNSALRGVAFSDTTEFDVEVVPGEEAQCLRVAEFSSGRRVATNDLGFDARGLLVRYRRTPDGDRRGTPGRGEIRYTWTEAAALFRLEAIDLTTSVEGVDTRVRYVISWKDAGGLSLPCAVGWTIQSGSGPAVEWPFELAHLVVNGKPADGVGPAPKRNGASPAATSLIAGFAAKSYRATASGLRSAAGDVTMPAATSAVLARFELGRNGTLSVQTDPISVADAEARREIASTLQFPLSIGIGGLGIPESPDYDAEVVEEEARRVLRVREYVAGILSASVEYRFDDRGLVTSMRRLGGPNPDRPESEVAIGFSWEGVSDRFRIRAATLRQASAGAESLQRFDLSYAVLDELSLPVAFTMTEIDLAGHETSLECRIGYTKLNGSAVEEPAEAPAPVPAEGK